MIFINDNAIKEWFIWFHYDSANKYRIRFDYDIY